MGIHSGDWYSLKTENWKKTTRPDPVTLKNLISKELGLPEPVTNPWSPPTIPRQKITEPTPSKTVGPQFCVGCGSPLAAGQMFCKECGKQATSTPKPVTRRPRPHLPATRNLLIGILLSVLVSAPFPYMYYLVGRQTGRVNVPRVYLHTQFAHSVRLLLLLVEGAKIFGCI